MLRGGRFAAGVAALAMATAAVAETESLREALVKTYEANPTLMAERARLRATDESVAIARAAGRPQVSATAGVNQDLVTSNIRGSNGRDFSAGADVSLPLFAGGTIPARTGFAAIFRFEGWTRGGSPSVFS